MPGQCVFPTRVEQKRQQGAPAPCQGYIRPVLSAKPWGQWLQLGQGAVPIWRSTPSCYVTRSHYILFMVSFYSQAFGVI